MSVWNTQWLLGTLAGVNHCRSGGEGLPSIEEVENEGEEVEVSSNYIHVQHLCVCIYCHDVDTEHHRLNIHLEHRATRKDF